MINLIKPKYFMPIHGEYRHLVYHYRLRLAHDGIVLILLALEKLNGNIISGPDIISRGFVFEDASQDVLYKVKELLLNTIKGLDKELLSDTSLLQAKLRSTLKKYLRDTMDRRPMIMPIILEI